MASSGPFVELFVKHWQELRLKLAERKDGTVIDGRGLTLADVVASARYGKSVAIAKEVLEYVGRNTEQVYGKIEEGQILYGINTGFGGSANVRTKAIEEIQRGLIRGLHYGILSGKTDFDITSTIPPIFATAKPLSEAVETTTMPETWVRASILIRLNSLSYGASGVRPQLLTRLLQLLNMDIIPRVPLRGSISASGDLSPLSYLGGVIQGKPSVQAWVRDQEGHRKLLPADQALKYGKVKPIDIRAKEGLAIVNGTATSAAVASLAIHEVICLAAVSQVLTAMSVEALCGTDESFHAFFSQVRPHPGQMECAASIERFLLGSDLVAENTGSEEFSMRQDRYAIRTAPQWIGPVLEDLVLSHSQVTIEINSVTDNPLMHPESGKMLHGGNFQAKVITSAMEKARQGCQTIGQILFAQCTEMINPATNKGLAPNLVVDEPSQSWMWKGTDIYIAALQSELGFLSGPVGHVQFAEMGNQSINSLALISGRYTLTAIDILTQLTAAHLVALCQALDLRALYTQFLYALAPKFKTMVQNCLENCIMNDRLNSNIPEHKGIAHNLWIKFSEISNQTTHMDSAARFSNAINYLQTSLLQEVSPTQQSLKVVQKWGADCVNEACKTYEEVRAQYLEQPDAKPVLGRAAKKLYAFVRETLRVPFFGEEYIRTAEWEDVSDVAGRLDPKFQFRTMGSMISAVYEALRNGSLYSVVVDCFEDTV
ncbi:phenylalanine ammonia-lyase [Lojkania enalia]|uniref:Phenylalanine ammonia-lyase n=1 Tax=Lojkania enalia TaxID=147567 RepID=A0A9P4MY45_9PLEO|nr:phenylalanine ammonia-lyase [Didymosphaeria enalia]